MTRTISDSERLTQLSLNKKLQELKQKEKDNEELRRIHKGVAKTLPEMKISIIFT